MGFFLSLGRVGKKKCPQKNKTDTDGFSHHANMVERLVNIKWYSATLQTVDLVTNNVSFKQFRNSCLIHLPIGYERCYHMTSWVFPLPQS